MGLERRPAAASSLEAPSSDVTIESLGRRPELREPMFGVVRHGIVIRPTSNRQIALVARRRRGHLERLLDPSFVIKNRRPDTRSGFITHENVEGLAFPLRTKLDLRQGTQELVGGQESSAEVVMDEPRIHEILRLLERVNSGLGVRAGQEL